MVLAVFATVAAPGAGAQGVEFKSWAPRKPVPAVEATDLTGKLWRLPDLRGKFVLINFWASWCEPCRAEMPSLQALAQRPGPPEVVVLAINYKESPAIIQRFVQNTDLQLPVLSDPEGHIARRWGITVFPSTVVMGPDGRVRGVLRGELDWSGPEAARLLSPGP